ncbi:MAG: HAMP domain-containing sensor histidine kinase, partial [Pseudomonadota bacterium]
IGLALLMALLSSLALILFITIPMRRLARSADRVARNPQDYDSIPDLSYRRDEIGDLSVVIRDMTRGLYMRVDDIANFAADVAHEIKNPLTSLRSASDTLRVAKTDEDREKLIAIIQQDVSRMSRLITDISDASKVDANLARDTAQILDVGEIVANIVTFYEQTQADGNLTIKDVSDLSEPAFIRAFETPFAQVLRNLIDNAVTFSPENGTVRVGATATDSHVTITVSDEGPGIPEDNLETVFDRFYTERPSGATFGSHSGLGLAICRQIMTAHKGRIWADNLTDEDGNRLGAQFTVELPRQTEGNSPSQSRRKR